MSDTSSDGAKKLIEQPNNDPSEVMGQISVTTGDSDETSPSLSDMPIDVVGLIIDELDYRQQLKLRKVSKSLRELVDRQIPACKKIVVDCGDGGVDIAFDKHYVMYTDHEVESDDDDYYDDDDDDDVNVVRDDFKKAAFDDLASTLKNPKLQLEELCFEVNESMTNNYNKIKCVLESLNHQVRVKETDLRMSSLSSFLSVLPYLKPGLLEKITLRVHEKEADWSTFSIGMDQVVLLEQWKQAKELEMWDPFDEFQMKHATHFKRFRIHLKPDGGKFARIKEFLSKLDNLELCTLSFNAFSPDDTRSIYELLGEPVSSNTTEEVFHHPIPDSDCFFEIKKSIDSYQICFHITKKMRKGNR